MHYTGNDLYLERYEIEDSLTDDTKTAVANYEVPIETLQRECPYEQETHSMPPNITYEPSINIYEVPDPLEVRVSER